MATPLAKAAKRGATRRAVPITVARPAPRPSSSRCRSTSVPLFATAPASASPHPSRIDFLPRLTTSPERASAHAAAPPTYEATPALIEAAKKEGTIVFYTSTDVEVAEKLGAAFEKRYPGIKVQTERNGAERILQRLTQEYGSNIHAADVVETS